MTRPADKTLGQWRPSLWVYLGKIALLGVITSCGLVALGIWANVQFADAVWALPLLPVCLVLYLAAFEDPAEWIRHRNDVWTLNASRLEYRNPNEEDRFIALADIASVTGWMFWSLRIKLRSGLVTSVHFVPNRQEMRMRIEEALRHAK